MSLIYPESSVDRALFLYGKLPLSEKNDLVFKVIIEGESDLEFIVGSAPHMSVHPAYL